MKFVYFGGRIILGLQFIISSFLLINLILDFCRFPRKRKVDSNFSQQQVRNFASLMMISIDLRTGRTRQKTGCMTFKRTVVTWKRSRNILILPG
jgi:hypothetical protein